MRWLHELKMLSSVIAHFLLEIKLLGLCIILLLQLPIKILCFLIKLLIDCSQPALHINKFVFQLLLVLNHLWLLAPEPIDIFFHTFESILKPLDLLSAFLLSLLRLGILKRQFDDLLLLSLKLFLDLLADWPLLLQELDKRVELLRHGPDSFLSLLGLCISASKIKF